MVTYDYHCDANETTLTVRHSIKETLATWGELCAQVNQHPGDTPPETPIRRLLGGGNVMLKGTKCATSQGSSCSCC